MKTSKIIEIVKSWEKFASDRQDTVKIGSRQWEYYIGMEIGAIAIRKEILEEERRSSK
ncbi:MAG TPA: hypothetical protein VEP90_30350 [Methylomirabilota bacterium]|nr:hypothetical protein [Methylomirabilota bacterium]